MAKWVPTWRYVPIDFNQELGVLENITQKCVFRNNIGGTALRVRFNNLYSDDPMAISHASLALHNRVTGRVTSRFPVTYRGSSRICVEANSRPYSDVIDLTVTPEDDILLSLYFGEKTVLRSVCTSYTGIAWQSFHQTGDYAETDALGFTIREQLVPGLAHDPYPLHFAAGVCDISLLTGDDVQLIALFGDSITHMSFFMDPFLDRLCQRFPGRYAVMNAGISGNRLQKSHPVMPGFPGEGCQFGIAGKDRFYADVYDGAAPDIVFIMEGVNDCSHSLCFREPAVPTAEDIFEALCEVTDWAKRQGSRVYFGTIAPFGSFGEPWREQAEALRQDYNRLIRTSCIADGIADMDAALRDPDDVHRMQEGFHLGDGVHPNWLGGERMAGVLAETLLSTLR